MQAYKMLVVVSKELVLTIESENEAAAMDEGVMECSNHGEIVNKVVQVLERGPLSEATKPHKDEPPKTETKAASPPPPPPPKIAPPAEPEPEGEKPAHKKPPASAQAEAEADRDKAENEAMAKRHGKAEPEPPPKHKPRWGRV